MGNHLSRFMRFVFVLLLMLGLTSESSAQKVGDRIVVTANFETKIHKDPIDKVFEGEIHTITTVNGKWCALDNVKGWLPLQYVMNLETAKKYYDKRIKSEENDADAFAHRGLIHYEQQKFTEAFSDLNASLRINQRNPVTWSNRGMVLNAQQKYPLAIKDLTYAIKLNPKFPHAHFNLGRVNYAVKEYEKAIASYNEAIKLDGNVPRYFVNRGSAKLYNRDFEGARNDYLNAIKLDNRNADAYVGLSNLELSTNKLEKAREYADKAVRYSPRNAMALNARGWAQYKLGNVDEAIFDLTKANRYAPTLSLAYNNRGVCYAAKREFDKAIADYNALLKLNSDDPIGFANRGVAYMGKGEFKKAKTDFETAIAKAPEMSDGLNSFAWFLSTCPDDNFRNGEKAVELATKSCELSNWKDWSYLETLAVAQAEVGNSDKALQSLAKSKELAPSSKMPELEAVEEVLKDGKPFRSQTGKNSESGVRQ